MNRDRLDESRLPIQRWQIARPQLDQASQLSLSTGMLPLVAQVIINRGIETPELAHSYIEPESQHLASPMVEFVDLKAAVELLAQAIALGEKIAICGDYDADGMTSTALLLRALKHLGADVDYAIPSRMKDGYGINNRIVTEFAENGVGLILTVDNGIAAYEPVALAVELGLSVIITDHHDLPPQLPPADAILNPKLLADTSPYKGLAGVGVAYILAIATAQSLNKVKGLTNSILELFTLGTIADLAPLVGVNRRWLKRGLRQLPNSELPGVQALIQVAGVDEAQKQLQPDDIGFKLGPRINAVGRIGDPQMVIELLTTEDPGIALERAMQCEQINQKRRQLCEQIETQAIALIESTPIPWKEARVLVVVADNWHHGVIGIVASRLVERYGVPVFIGTYEEDARLEVSSSPQVVREEHRDIIRGSARGIEEFNIFAALNYCRDLLGKFGGHKAAGGFSFPASNLAAIKQKLSEFAHQSLEPEHLKPLVKIDAQTSLQQIDFTLYQQIESLQPWGIGNPTPVFWTPNVRVIEQQIVGKNHLKIKLQEDNSEQTIKAIAWRWSEYFPLPNRLDIAYKLKQNNWQGATNIELEIVGVRLPKSPAMNQIISAKKPVQKAVFTYNSRIYICSLQPELKELRIRNDRGKVLAVNQGDRLGLLGTSRQDAKQVNVTQSPYFQLIKAALKALNINH
ncbi:MAG: single-stranded-DNA-specific exonuclease RecJ [Pleurocapsa sp.]